MTPFDPWPTFDVPHSFKYQKCAHRKPHRHPSSLLIVWLVVMCLLVLSQTTPCLAEMYSDPTPQWKMEKAVQSNPLWRQLDVEHMEIPPPSNRTFIAKRRYRKQLQLPNKRRNVISSSAENQSESASVTNGRMSSFKGMKGSIDICLGSFHQLKKKPMKLQASSTVTKPKNARLRTQNKWTNAYKMALTYVQNIPRPSKATSVIDAALTTKISTRSQSIANINSEDDHSFNITASVDLLALIRLGQHAGTALGMFGNAFLGTLRILGPMLVGRRILTFWGYVFYDHYTGRYIRSTYNRHRRLSEKYEIISFMRAVLRCIVQVAACFWVGRILERKILTLPCWIHPNVCHAWLSIIWLTTTIASSSGILTIVMELCPSLQIRPYISGRQKPTRKQFLFQSLRAVVTAMKNPEEWLMSVIKRSPNNIDNVKRWSESNRQQQPQLQPQPQPTMLSPPIDPIFLPSTWLPLNLLGFIAISRVLLVSLWPEKATPGTSSHANVISRKSSVRLYIISWVVQAEWFRLLLGERRIMLSLIFQIFVGMPWSLAWARLMFQVDTSAAIVLIPPLLLTLVLSVWMNGLLAWEGGHGHRLFRALGRHRRQRTKRKLRRENEMRRQPTSMQPLSKMMEDGSDEMFEW